MVIIRIKHVVWETVQSIEINTWKDIEWLAYCYPGFEAILKRLRPLSCETPEEAAEEFVKYFNDTCSWNNAKVVEAPEILPKPEGE